MATREASILKCLQYYSKTNYLFSVLLAASFTWVTDAQQVYGPDAIRLVGGNNTNEGRVEVYHNGEWGTVCDDSWDRDDSTVVCRQLGLPYDAAKAVGNAQFGEGTGQIWLDGVTCKGSENRLNECGHQGWGNHKCSHSEDASVICRDGIDNSFAIRLVGGSHSNEGRVEVYHNGEWGTVCDDYWTANEATVVCRQLGLPLPNGAAEARGEAYFGEGTGQVWLDDVSCAGGESGLHECGHQGWGINDCYLHTEDAGVICTDDSSQVRLSGGDGAWQGTVEVFYNDTWGKVCNSSWDWNDSQVVCRQLGYSGAKEVVNATNFAYVGGQTLFYDAKCNGTEARLQDCKGTWGNTSSNCDNSAVVDCIVIPLSVGLIILIVFFVSLPITCPLCIFCCCKYGCCKGRNKSNLRFTTSTPRTTTPAVQTQRNDPYTAVPSEPSDAYPIGVIKPPESHPPATAYPPPAANPLPAGQPPGAIPPSAAYPPSAEPPPGAIPPLAAYPPSAEPPPGAIPPSAAYPPSAVAFPSAPPAAYQYQPASAPSPSDLPPSYDSIVTEPGNVPGAPPYYSQPAVVFNPDTDTVNVTTSYPTKA